MTSDRVLTGVEVELRASKANETVMKVLHALHLDSAATRFQASMVKVLVKVDGKEAVHPMHGHYFVECAPGEHELEVALLGALDATGAGKVMSKATLRVTVLPDHVTMVNYVMGIGVAAYTLESAGTRPG